MNRQEPTQTDTAKRQPWRVLHPEEHRRWYEQWYLTNREVLLRERRAARLASRKRVTEGELRRCQDDHKLAGKIRGSLCVVCLECGQVCQALGAHLHRVHGMTVLKYRERWRDAPVVSQAVSKAFIAKRREQRGDERRRLAVQEKWRNEFPDWPIYERCLAGESYASIGEALEMEKGTVGYRARLLGFHGKPCLYDFGRPVDSGFVRWWQKQSDLSASELATRIDLSSHPLEGTPHRPDRRLRPAIARKLIAWRDQILAALLHEDFRRGQKSWSSRGSILKTLVPDFIRVWGLLLEGLKWLRLRLRENLGAGVKEMQQWLCQEAGREETAWRESGQPSREVSFLPLVAELIFRTFEREHGPSYVLDLERDVQRLRGDEPLHRIGWDCVASRFGTTRSVVQSAVSSHAHMVPPPAKLGALIDWLDAKQARARTQLEEKESRRQELLDRPDAQAKKQEGGRPRGRPREVYDEQCRQMESLREQGLSWRECTKRVAPHEYAEAEAAGAASVKTLIERHRGALRQYQKRKLRKAPQ